MPTVADFVRIMERFAPLSLAAEWDNVGLLLGDPSREVRRVMTCLTVTPESVAEAVRENANLIVSHHPILFRPVQKVTTANTEGRMLLDLAKAEIAVYSAHTAYDNAPGGINDGLARRLGLTQVRHLRSLPTGKDVKLVVFVPDADLGKVSDAVFAAGAGVIGQYRECSFRLSGTGTFFGGDATNPTVGQKGRRENVAEWRLEVVCPSNRLETVIRAMRQAHSYEEPAFDIYPLQPDPSRHGQGRIGILAEQTTLGGFASRIKASLGAKIVQTVGDESRSIRTVALACGAAGEFLSDAIRQNADVFLTGEIRFHDALSAQARGIALVIPGHHATERPGLEELAERLAKEHADVTVWPSRDERDPLA
jgi:dinuclear metal center YbgI/SA1388 family protein